MEKRAQNPLFILIFIILLGFVLFSFVGGSSSPTTTEDDGVRINFEDVNFIADRDVLEYDENAPRESQPGAILGWGSNTHGQLGYEPARKSRTIEAVTAQGHSGSMQMAAGWLHTISLGSDGKAYTWGMDNKGQLGKDSVSGFSHSTDAIVEPTNVVDVDVSLMSSILLDAEGTVWTFGSNYNGQLGDGTNDDSHLPISVEGLPKIVNVDMGYRFSMAVDENGELWVWGATCSDENLKEFERIMEGVADNLSLLGGYFDINGEQFNGRDPETDCMNENVVGIRSRVPKKIPQLDNVVDVSGGYGHILALNDEGEVYSLGCNAFGQLGRGHNSNNKNNQLAVKIQDLDNIVQISAGFRHSLALDADGNLWSWGHNRRGQLGLLDKIIRDTPEKVPLPEGTKIVKMSAGHDFSVALDTEGNIWFMGDTQGRWLFDSAHETSSYSEAVDHRNIEIVHGYVASMMKFEVPVTDIFAGGQHIIFKVD